MLLHTKAVSSFITTFRGFDWLRYVVLKWIIRRKKINRMELQASDFLIAVLRTSLTNMCNAFRHGWGWIYNLFIKGKYEANLPQIRAEVPLFILECWFLKLCLLSRLRAIGRRHKSQWLRHIKAREQNCAFAVSFFQMRVKRNSYWKFAKWLRTPFNGFVQKSEKKPASHLLWIPIHKPTHSPNNSKKEMMLWRVK